MRRAEGEHTKGPGRMRSKSRRGELTVTKELQRGNLCARQGAAGGLGRELSGQRGRRVNASGLWEEEESKVEWIGGGGCQRRACQSDGELRGGQKQARCMNAGGGASCVAMQAGGRGKRAWRLGKGEGQGSMRCSAG